MNTLDQIIVPQFLAYRDTLISHYISIVLEAVDLHAPLRSWTMTFHPRCKKNPTIQDITYYITIHEWVTFAALLILVLLCFACRDPEACLCTFALYIVRCRRPHPVWLRSLAVQLFHISCVVPTSNPSPDQINKLLELLLLTMLPVLSLYVTWFSLYSCVYSLVYLNNTIFCPPPLFLALCVSTKHQYKT